MRKPQKRYTSEAQIESLIQSSEQMSAELMEKGLKHEAELMATVRKDYKTLSEGERSHLEDQLKAARKMIRRAELLQTSKIPKLKERLGIIRNQVMPFVADISIPQT